MVRRVPTIVQAIPRLSGDLAVVVTDKPNDGAAKRLKMIQIIGTANNKGCNKAIVVNCNKDSRHPVIRFPIYQTKQKKLMILKTNA